MSTAYDTLIAMLQEREQNHISPMCIKLADLIIQSGKSIEQVRADLAPHIRSGHIQVRFTINKQVTFNINGRYL